MSGKRQPTALVEANGRKHLTRAEADARRDAEVHAPVPEQAIPPKWLPKTMRKDFRAIGKSLIALGVYSDLDADTLGRYLVAHTQYLTATGYANAALRAGNLPQADAWGRIQERYFKQARNCANDLGLTVSARCRLVMPPAPDADEDSDEFTRRLQARQAAAAAGVI
jgi:P27 family predicted phage terminase small subunit